MDVKIFVSHRVDLAADCPQDPVFVPVRSGAVYDKNPLTDLPGDDTGENISEKNPSYCELTLQYWAWKNCQADYYGLCHYRRFLSFSEETYKPDPYGNILEGAIDEEAIRDYGLSGEQIRKRIEGYDIVTCKPVKVSSFPERYSSIRDHYARAPFLYEKDVDLLLEAIAECYSDYLETAQEYFAGKIGYFCQLFVMKRELFFSYCEWLFGILKALDSKLDMTYYCRQSLRTPGHLAERLFGIFLQYQRKQNPDLKVLELQTVLFRKPEKLQTVLPAAFPGKETVPVVLAANNAFAPVCAVAIRSLLDYVNPEKYYDIIVLHSDIDKENQRWIQSMRRDLPQVSIRFLNTSFIVGKYKLRAQEHISVETYYRFLIPEILPDYGKVLYLDSDLICRRDVAELYAIDLGENWIGAVADPDMQGQITLHKDACTYVKEHLQMPEPYRYFQAGVLLLNTRAMLAAHTVDEWLTFAASTHYRYGDQDILNRYCYEKAYMLDMRWNLLIDCDHIRVPVLVEAAPDEVRKSYHESRKDPWIVHYAGYRKPWNDPDCDLSPYFWEVAKETPFYEKLLAQMCGAVGSGSAQPIVKKSRFVAFAKKHCPKFLYPLAKKIQWSYRPGAGKFGRLLPKGSKRRENIKKMICFLKRKPYVEPDYEAEGITPKYKKKK